MKSLVTTVLSMGCALAAGAQVHTEGVAYNEKADRRSWEAMRQFFAELFK